MMRRVHSSRVLKQGEEYVKDNTQDDLDNTSTLKNTEPNKMTSSHLDVIDKSETN